LRILVHEITQRIVMAGRNGAGDQLLIRLVPGGGQAIRLVPLA